MLIKYIQLILIKYFPMNDNQMQAPQTEEEKKTQTFESENSCRCPVFRIVFFSVLIIGAVSGLSLVFTGSSNPLDYFVPVDPPGESEAFRWNAESGLELMVEVSQHIQKEETKLRRTHLTYSTFSLCVLTILRMHVIQAGRRLLTNQLRTGTLANLLIYAPDKFHMNSIATHPMGV
jgi:hypothetical protein